MTYNFVVIQARKEDINLPCAWIRVPSLDKKLKKGPVKITYNENKKKCYLQCRIADDTLNNHKSYNKICKNYHTENAIFISEHYRDILDIKKGKITRLKDIINASKLKKDEITNKCELDIDFPKGKCCRYWYSYMAAWQHPDIYAKVSICLAVVSFFTSILGIILSSYSQGIANLLQIDIGNVYSFFIGALFSCIAYICFCPEQNFIFLIAIISLIILIIA